MKRKNLKKAIQVMWFLEPLAFISNYSSTWINLNNDLYKTNCSHSSSVAVSNFLYKFYRLTVEGPYKQVSTNLISSLFSDY